MNRRAPTGVVPAGRMPTAVAPADFVPADFVPPGIPILLDSSALLSYLDGSESVSPIAREILDGWVRSGRNDGLVSAVSVMETLVRPIAAGASAHRAVIGFLCGFPNLRLAVGARHPVTNDASWRPRLSDAWPDATVLTLAELAGAMQSTVAAKRTGAA